MAAPVHPPSGKLEDIVIKRRRRERLRAGLTAPYLEDFAAALVADGHHRVTVCHAVRLAHWFGGFAVANGISSAADLTEELADRFAAKRARLARLRPREAVSARGHVRRFLAFLRLRGVLRERSGDPVPAERIIEEFIAFARDHRGVRSQTTFDGYRAEAGAFLASLGERTNPSGLASIGPADIRQLLVSRCEGLSRSGRLNACAAVRAFLRFARVRGYVARDLVEAVPVIPRYSLDRVPPVLAWEDIRKTIAAIDVATAKGKRDRALLLILATYGMRIGQICGLTFDDVDWRHGTIRFRAAKGGRDVVLPLTSDVGEALIAWLRVRPPTTNRAVFLRMRAPLRPLRSNLYQLIERYARKAGVEAAIVGARTWRHGRATRMLERGLPLKTIRDLLGHRSIESTFIYTKVDLPMLRQAALEWPGGAA